MKNDSTEERRPYEKPELRRVTLKPEESLAAGCKMTGMSAPAGNPCTINSCFNSGS